MKKLVTIIIVIIIAAYSYNSYKTNDSVATDWTAGDCYEVTGIVTEVDHDVVVFEADMPDGSIHIWAAHGQGFEKGQLVNITLGDNNTPDRYNDDGINRVAIIR